MMSIRIKIFLLFLGVVLLSAGYYQSFWLPNVLRTARTEAAAMTRRHLSMIEQGLALALMNDRLAELPMILDHHRRANPDWLAVSLYDANGRRLYPDADVPPPRGAKIRTVAYPVRAHGKELGRLSVTVDLSHAMDPMLADYRWLAIQLGGGMLLFLLCLGVALDIMVSRPARGLADAANRLAQGDFNARLPRRCSDEIGALVTSFAAMRDRIRADQVALRRARDDLESRVLERTLDLHETNEALIKSEAAFRDFAESASDRFWECDRNYRISHRWDSDNVDKRLPRSEFTNRTYWDIHPGASVRRLKTVMEKNQAFRD